MGFKTFYYNIGRLYRRAKKSYIKNGFIDLLKKFYRMGKTSIYIRFDIYRIKRINSIEDLLAYSTDSRYSYFVKYIGLLDEGKYVSSRLLDSLGIDFNGFDVLSIGPGVGPFLEVAMERGARSGEFFDYDPIFVRYLELKGYKGHWLNFIEKAGFDSKSSKQYDFILSKGSITGDWFNDLFEEPIKGYIMLPDWLDQIEEMIKPGGYIVIAPTFYKNNVPERFYTCKDIDAFRDSKFTKTMFDHGYILLSEIDGWSNYKNDICESTQFPFTFYKQKDR